MSAVEHFRRIPLFADLSADEMMDVLRMATVVQVPPKQRLCTQGTASDCLFIIEEGEGAVQVTDAQGRTREVSRIGAGEVLGELGLVDGQVRSADVVALSAVRAYRIDRAQFDQMRAAMNPAAYKMLRRIALTVSARLREINSAISEQVVPGERAPRVTREPEAPVGRASRVTREPEAPVGRASRVHGAASAAVAGAQPAKNARLAREPEERGLLRSVLARLSGAGR